MARCREFDEREALRRARDVFWARGYADTSVADLIQATGVCRQSLYNTFGSKSRLFAAAMADYRDAEMAGVLALLQAEQPLRPLLERFLSEVIELMLKCGPRGCLFVNAMAEQQAVGPAARALLAANAARYEEALGGVIGRAQLRGEAVTGRPPAEVARFILNTMLGLSASARIGGNREGMRSVVGIALDAVADATTAARCGDRRIA